MVVKHGDRQRTRQIFTLVGREHRGGRAGNERLVCHLKDDPGLLAIWGTTGVDMRHIDELEGEIARAGFPIAVECDWIQPDRYEAEHFGHRYWVWQTDHLQILKQ